MTFRDAVEACAAPVPEAYRAGKGAMTGAESQAVTCADNRRFVGSADLDEAHRALPDHAQAPRWDYVMGVRTRRGHEALWLEFHPASDGDVDAMVAKLGWLRSLLRGTLRPLADITPPDVAGGSPFIWMASGRVSITPNSPAARRLRTSGLRWPVRVLNIPADPVA